MTTLVQIPDSDPRLSRYDVVADDGLVIGVVRQVWHESAKISANRVSYKKVKVWHGASHERKDAAYVKSRKAALAFVQTGERDE